MKLALPVIGVRAATFTKSGKEMSPYARLRKLSLHLKGVTPTSAEYDALEAAMASGHLPDFFQTKTGEYLKTPEYIGKMMDRLDSLFRMMTDPSPPEGFLLSTPSGIPNSPTSQDLLYYEILSQNLSWDNLLTRKQYLLPDVVGGFTGGMVLPSSDDRSFLQMVLPDITAPLQPTTIGQITANRAVFADTDSRIAGAITTQRFFSRYSTTNVNKNRGRAAAVFRTFLCDDMKAVVASSAGDDQDLVNQAFPKPSLDNVHLGVADDDPHGSDPNCMACHYKLDPLGRTFLTSGSVLSDDTSPGALVYRRPNGQLVNVAGNGIGEVAAAIQAQPEYSQCQVMRFWNWFIQGDDPPTLDRFTELVKQFDGMKHLTNDYVAYLVNQPEFYRDPDQGPQNVTLTQVKNTLQRCTNCHSGVTPPANQNPMPSFVQLPIGSDTDHPKWIKAIIKDLDLAGSGENRVMPPPTSAWQPTDAELALIKEWIATGVRDESGKITIDPQITQGWLK